MDREGIRQVLRERGWCQIYADGCFYNTIGNANDRTISTEEANGWELVGIFAPDDDMAVMNDPSATGNLTVFRKPAPPFFLADNPWVEKGSMPWLPDLTTGIAK